MIDFKIILHSSICDQEMEELAVTASEHGISDFTVTDSGRIIIAETIRDDEAILWVTQWLADALFIVEDIAYIEEKRIFWPEFTEEEEEPRGEINVEIRFDEDS